MPPKVIAKNADRTAGVLPVNATARAGTNKQQAARLKLEVRRLPPGLTLNEFEETLGDEWKLGGGKVDWREYRQGKIRTSGYGKIPEQSRCYVHLVNEACVKDFEKRFLEVTFQDKAGTHKSSDLKHLPPTLGFAPNQRTPLQQSKQRVDNRQGTIDQEPEFIAFLEAETQPLTKPAALEIPGAEKENIVVKSTPLIDDLRERKANKAKAAQAKADKTKDKKATGTKAASKEGPATGQKDAAGNKQQKVEQAAKEAAKVLNKQAAGKQQQTQSQAAKSTPAAKSKKTSILQSPKPSAETPAQSASPIPTGPAGSTQQKRPQRVRGNTDGIKKMLQKDLGIKPESSAASKTTKSATPAATPSEPDASPATTPTSPTKQAVKGTEKSKAASSTSSDKRSPHTKAYLKHANPSQGMTEAVIQSALAQYGTVTSVSLDTRKGTAVAVFEDVEGVKKALDAKRLTIANGAVEIHEYRERSSGGGGSGRGGFKGGRGGGKGGKEAAGGSKNAASSANTGNAASAAPPSDAV